MKRPLSILTTGLLILLLGMLMAGPAVAAEEEYHAQGGSAESIFTRLTPEETSGLAYMQGEPVQFTASSPHGSLAGQDTVLCGLTATGQRDPNLLVKLQQGIDKTQFTYIGQVDINTKVSGEKIYTANLATDQVEPGVYLFWLLHYSPSKSEGSYSYMAQTITITANNSTPEPEPEPKPAGLIAKPTAAAVYIDGHAVSFDAYNIQDNNYFKLRDLAYILSDTVVQFEVGWQAATATITLTRNQPYTIVGGEMARTATGDQTPTPSKANITLDEQPVSFSAYNINGNNYFKLRDIGAALNFRVDWDAAKNAILIDTTIPYQDE